MLSANFIFQYSRKQTTSNFEYFVCWGCFVTCFSCHLASRKAKYFSYLILSMFWHNFNIGGLFLTNLTMNVKIMTCEKKWKSKFNKYIYFSFNFYRLNLVFIYFYMCQCKTICHYPNIESVVKLWHKLW